MIYEALVKIGDNVNSSLSPEEQARYLWKHGDIVAVRPLGWQWGRREVKEFLIVQLPENITPTDLDLLSSSHLVAGEKTDKNGEKTTLAETICRSRHHLDIDALLVRTNGEDNGEAMAKLSDISIEYQPCRGTTILPDEIVDKCDKVSIQSLTAKCVERLREECEHINIDRRRLTIK